MAKKNLQWMIMKSTRITTQRKRSAFYRIIYISAQFHWLLSTGYH